jgi:hypothetical protein
MISWTIMADSELTEAEWEEFRKKTADPAWCQDENGIDLSLIDHMLSLTPAQRLEALEQELAFDDMLTEASVKLYGSDPRAAVEAEFGRG